MLKWLFGDDGANASSYQQQNGDVVQSYHARNRHFPAGRDSERDARIWARELRRQQLGLPNAFDTYNHNRKK